MKCPKCRARIDDGLDRCTLCGAYLKSSIMEEYKKDDYDPMAGYQQQAPPTQQNKKKSKFKLFGKRAPACLGIRTVLSSTLQEVRTSDGTAA